MCKMGFLHDVLCSQKLLFGLHDSNLYLYNQRFLYSPNVTLQKLSAAVILQCLHHTKLHVTHSLSPTFAVFMLICIVFLYLLLLTLP